MAERKNLKRKHKFKRLETRIGERNNHIFALGQMTSETFLALFPISLLTNNKVTIQGKFCDFVNFVKL